ncbi:MULTISPECIES: histidine kinase N-terminal domain-containing protein [Geobacillus]|uniref:histidine kinase n=2 Tax=Geobacillus thermodenitrificans TaxID=33940 RepID=A4IN38_GEOTN|nr:MULTISPECIES: histidine kinase N-terminal domain-containing protein [Geobacillus]ABO66742.1 Sensor histidine kinase [Geobacillus thermodenitrificans NG80-2]ATO36172.1 histidine kinase [Geobacillus thermodenitrificans]KQB93574.1 histidine kinase [Geobacillus sp. PA-3]MEC5186396.1 signal transduction histidine kinase [Geobacillus thermodenitrificans]MED0661548.1 GHKL domain-containing protein [Geobacillus thermodenitrificans]
MVSAAQQLVTHLEAHLPCFLAHWRQQMKIAADDKYIDRVEQNSLAMFTLVKEALSQSLSGETVERLANKVAKERAEMNAGIGTLVYNVNLGRRLIIKHALTAPLPITELAPLIDHMNELFDQFLFHAVKEYNELKEAELREKNMLIARSHQDRLTLLGQMSSSFVHEFRNPLTAIIGFIQLLKFEHPHLPYLDIIDHELQQLKFRISQFLHASRKEIVESEKETFSLRQLLEEIMDFLYATIVDSDVDISLAIDESIHIFAYKDQLRQVLVNILLNSIEAVKEKEKPRRIKIAARSQEGRVIIEIANNGPAIPADIVETIFEPFFTTKKLGTGIGLYICKKVIEDHGGEISCSSDANMTTFSIRLPV